METTLNTMVTSGTAADIIDLLQAGTAGPVLCSSKYATLKTSRTALCDKVASSLTGTNMAAICTTPCGDLVSRNMIDKPPGKPRSKCYSTDIQFLHQSTGRRAVPGCTHTRSMDNMSKKAKHTNDPHCL